MSRLTDRVEIVAIGADTNFHSLRIGQVGKVTGICKDYCVWVKFDNYNPEEEPSKRYGFPFYFDEVKPYALVSGIWAEYQPPIRK